MHSLLAKSRQPYETADYATFTAEIASTTNEQLLARYMVDHAQSNEEKLFYLGQQMEQFRSTFFRQTMFAEFELRIHDMAEAGQGLSGERFTALDLELLRKYHGPGMEMDPLYAIEWAYIPHFYRTFYVFQYATSVSGAVYFALRQRMLGLPDLHYYDIYPPLVRNDRHFSLAEMRTTTLAAVQPLGPEYQRLLAGGTAARWMDPFPRQGKTSGAYMNGGAYDVHPYLLLNLGENYEGMTTFAHEWGHAMHSLLAKSRQPYETADYATFTAEIASTTNEQLLARYMVDHAQSNEEKLFYLGQQMEQFRSTFFRQTMFAEFELHIHDMAEAGQGLSGERFTALYLELLRKYHGPGMEMDPLYAIEWAYIPHFYRTFYVFQYATSVSGAVYFAQSVLRGGAAERERYLDALRAGGSDYPVEILRRSGLDMTTPAPYQALIAEFGRVMDQAEALLPAAH
jgi:oligoendopeptidase F